MSRGYTVNKRQRAQRKAEKKKAKEARRWQKREEGTSEPEIVSASDILGDLPSIDQAMANLPIAADANTVDRSARTIPARLFVGRLSWDTTERSLRRSFEKYGEVIDAVVATDRDTGRSRGFGFVELADRRDASEAISKLDGSELDGRQIVVNVATERGRRGPPRSHHSASYGHAATG